MTDREHQEGAERDRAEKPADRGGEVLEAARGVAAGAARTLRSGMFAVRDVHAASRRHASARERLHDLEGDYKVLPGHEGISTLSEERVANPYMLQAVGKR